MFFLLCVICAILSTSYGRPQQQQQQSDANTPIPIVSHAENVGDNGNFSYSFDTGNGIHYEQSGYTKETPTNLLTRSGANGEEENQITQVLSGSYSYTSPEGTVIQLSYIADENGYQPIGEHLPTPPPIPESIQRLLATLPQQQQQQQQDEQPITQ